MRIAGVRNAIPVRLRSTVSPATAALRARSRWRGSSTFGSNHTRIGAAWTRRGATNLSERERLNLFMILRIIVSYTPGGCAHQGLSVFDSSGLPLLSAPRTCGRPPLSISRMNDRLPERPYSAGVAVAVYRLLFSDTVIA